MNAPPGKLGSLAILNNTGRGGGGGGVHSTPAGISKDFAEGSGYAGVPQRSGGNRTAGGGLQRRRPAGGDPQLVG